MKRSDIASRDIMSHLLSVIMCACSLVQYKSMEAKVNNLYRKITSLLVGYVWWLLG